MLKDVGLRIFEDARVSLAFGLGFIDVQVRMDDGWDTVGESMHQRCSHHVWSNQCPPHIEYTSESAATKEPKTSIESIAID